jgi:hypothetical protein
VRTRACSRPRRDQWAEGGILIRRPRLSGSQTRVRRLGVVLVVLGALGLVLFAVGHVASSVVGQQVSGGETFRWTGELAYVKSLAGTQTCVIDDGSARPRHVTLAAEFSRGEGLLASHERIKPGGAYVSGKAGHRGAIECEADVIVSASWLIRLYIFAEGGLWVLVPAAASIASGEMVRRRGARRR